MRQLSFLGIFFTLLVPLHSFGVSENLKKKYCQRIGKSFEMESIVDIASKLPSYSFIFNDGQRIFNKLKSNKNKFIIDWESKLVAESTKDAWTEFYITNFVMSESNKKNLRNDAFLSELYKASYNKIFSKERFELIKRVFTDIKNDSYKMLDKWPIENKAKLYIKNKIKNISIYRNILFEKSKFKGMPKEFFLWGVSYDPLRNEINLGLNSLEYRTYDQLYSVLSHEIAHSFDSCRWSAFAANIESPFIGINQCLRSDISGIGAKKRDDSRLKELHLKGELTEELYMSLRKNKTCNKSVFPPQGAQRDQLDEVFADWFSSTLMGISKRQFSNIRSELCHHKKLSQGSSYTSNNRRLRFLYLANNNLLKKLGLKKRSNKIKFCVL